MCRNTIQTQKPNRNIATGNVVGQSKIPMIVFKANLSVSVAKQTPCLFLLVVQPIRHPATLMHGSCPYFAANNWIPISTIWIFNPRAEPPWASQTTTWNTDLESQAYNRDVRCIEIETNLCAQEINLPKIPAGAQTTASANRELCDQGRDDSQCHQNDRLQIAVARMRPCSQSIVFVDRSQ